MPKGSPVRNLLAALVLSIPKAKRRDLYLNSFAEETICFRSGALAEGVTLYVIDNDTPDRLWLNGMESDNGGRGHATAALRRLCDLADQHAVTLAGNALQYDPSDGRLPPGSFPSTTFLLAWYERFGFCLVREPEDGDSILIERPPLSNSSRAWNPSFGSLAMSRS